MRNVAQSAEFAPGGRAEQRKEIQSSKNQKLGQDWDKSAKNICLWVVCPPLQAEGHRFEPYNSHQWYLRHTANTICCMSFSFVFQKKLKSWDKLGTKKVKNSP